MTMVEPSSGDPFTGTVATAEEAHAIGEEDRKSDV
jgi:hypothetical protein